METKSRIMSYGIQTSDLLWALPILDHELWKQDDITQNSLHPNKHLALELGLQVSRIELINFKVLSLKRLNFSMTINGSTGDQFLCQWGICNKFFACHTVHCIIAMQPMLVCGLRTFRLGKTKTSPGEIGFYLKFYHLSHTIFMVYFYLMILTITTCYWQN